MRGLVSFPVMLLVMLAGCSLDIGRLYGGADAPLGADTPRDAPESLDAPILCDTATCGDGCVTGPSETCDDTNANAGDGCTDCAIEPGYECRGAPSVCMRPDRCEEGIDGPTDEDMDGVIDEHCPWYFTATVDSRTPSDYGGSFSSDGLTFYLDSGAALQTITRSPVGGPFGPPTLVNPVYPSFYVATASADECEVFVQYSTAPFGIGVLRRAPMGGSCRDVSFPLAPEPLNVLPQVEMAATFTVSNVVHPYLSSDGLELFVVALDAADDLNRAIIRLTRPDRLTDFTAAVHTGVFGDLPAAPGDGFTLFYRDVRTPPRALSRMRNGRDDAFGPEQRVDLVRPAYFAPTGEVLSATTVAGGTLLRSRACRSLPCPP